MVAIHRVWHYWFGYYLVGGFKHVFIVHNIWDNPSHWIVFFRGVEAIHPPTSQRLFGGLQHLPGSVTGFNPKLFWGSPQTHGLGSHLTLLRAIFFEGLKRLCTKVLVRVILAAGATSTLGAMLHVSGICTPPGWLSPGRQPPNLRTVGCPALVAEHPYKTILPSSSRFGIIMILQSPNWVLLPSGRTPWLHLSGQHQRRLQSPSTLGIFHHLLGLWQHHPPLGFHGHALQPLQQVGVPTSSSAHPWRQFRLSERLFGGLQHLPGSVRGFNPKPFWGSPQTHGLGSHLTLLRAIFFEGKNGYPQRSLCVSSAGAMSTLGAMLHVSGTCRNHQPDIMVVS